jgi:diketogulonate reductase-like aldo/keto reductase
MTNFMVYGTAWKEEHTLELVIKAVRAGFRSFDTAAQPKNYREDLVGEALREAIIPGHVQRKDLWVGNEEATF